MTPAKVTAMIVELIDVQAPDSTITYGFQHGSIPSHVDRSPLPASVSLLSMQTPPSELVGESTGHGPGDHLSRQLLAKLEALTAAVSRVEAAQARQTCRCGCVKLHSSGPPGRTEFHTDVHCLTSRGSETEPSRADYERLLRHCENQRVQSTPLASMLAPEALHIKSHPFGQGFPYWTATPSSPMYGGQTVKMPPNADQRAETSATAVPPIANPAASVAPALPHGPGNSTRLIVTDASTRRELPDQTGRRLVQPAGGAARTTSASLRSSAIGKYRNSTLDGSLRWRFLDSRLSNPSMPGGAAWGPAPVLQRASTSQSKTLADQLYERRRRQSREVAVSRDSN